MDVMHQPDQVPHPDLLNVFCDRDSSHGESPVGGKPLRVLVVHEVSYLKKPVYEYQDFPERLAARGHHVTVIDYDENGDGRHQVQSVSRTGLAQITLESTPHNGLPLLKYVSGRLQYRSLLEKKLRVNAFDVVLLYSVFINGTTTVQLCRKFGVPVVYRVLDAYHLLREGTLTRRLLLAGERMIYTQADHISVTNEKMRDYVREVASECAMDKIRVVNHGVDTAIFKLRPRDSELAQALRIAPTDRTVLFLGTTYAFSGLDVLIENFDQLVECIPNLKLLVIGGGELDGWLKNAVADRKLEDRVCLTGMVPYADVPRYLSLADIAINPFQINDITRNIIPIKILQYLASGLPVLSSPLHDLQQKFPEGECGITYADIADPEDYISRLGALAADGPLRKQLSEQALACIAQHYSIDVAVSAIEESMFDAAATMSHQ
ncbi:D-inositol-3-phosphate glycosyltransferase [Cupriavidus pinatubonensis]|uniref:D-inositol-3-phosphate glycosyltransferase n=2 Tax=Cupriavidus pinatubonensis TaxID=248026 RepID=A0ABM8XJ66_9BURK|nr:D-inositol-3-phosphate glycosyltransferase [Cupriavidus pinatubonensis]